MIERNSKFSDIRRFRELWRSENYKFWSFKSNHFALAAVIALPVAVVLSKYFLFLSSKSQSLSKFQVLADAVGSSYLPLLFVVGFLGLHTISGDYQLQYFRTMQITFANFRQLLLAKFVVILFWVGIASFVGVAVTVAVPLGVFHLFPTGAMMRELVDLGVFGALSAVLVALIALSIGNFSRSAMTGGIHLGMLLAVSPVLITLIFPNQASTLIGFHPLGAFQAIFTPQGANPSTLEGVQPSFLGRHSSFLVLMAWFVAYAATAFMPRSDSANFAPDRPERTKRLGSVWRFFSKASSGSVVISEIYKVISLRSFKVFAAIITVSYLGAGFALAKQNPFVSVLLDPNEGPKSLVLDAYSYQTLALTASAGLLQLVLVFLGSHVAVTDYSFRTIELSFSAVPKYFKLWVAKVTAGSIIVFSLLAFLGLVSTLVFTPIERGFGFPVQALSWVVVVSIATYSLLGCCCFLIGFAFGVFLRRSVSSILVGLAVFVILPSIFGVFQTTLAGSELVWLYNLHNYFPYLPGASRWVPPNELTPQFLWGGVQQFTASQYQNVIYAWTGMSLFVSFLVFPKMIKN